jgi:hypothetical protein
LWAQHPGRDDGRDRIGGIVQAVQEVEQQRDGDQSDQEGKTQRSIHNAAPALDLLNDDAVDLIRHVVKAIGDLFEVVVDFEADDEVHRVAIAMLKEQLL